MFGSSPRGASVYADIGMETGVVAASPHQLIMMLMEGASVAIAKAGTQMRAGNIVEKGRAITHAILIIDNGLRASLDHRVGDGELAGNLEALYSYMSRTLLSANVKNQPEMLEEVHGLLNQIKDAWAAIGPDSGGNAAGASNAQHFGAGAYQAKI